MSCTAAFQIHMGMAMRCTKPRSPDHPPRAVWSTYRRTSFLLLRAARDMRCRGRLDSSRPSSTVLRRLENRILARSTPLCLIVIPLAVPARKGSCPRCQSWIATQAHRRGCNGAQVRTRGGVQPPDTMHIMGRGHREGGQNLVAEELKK